VQDIDRNKILVIFVACIIGLAIIAGLVLKANNSDASADSNVSAEQIFSDLKFEDGNTIPFINYVHDNLEFAFSVVSNEKKKTDYYYNVLYDGQLMESGAFSIMPQSSNKKKIKVSLVLNNSSLIKVGRPNSTISYLKYNGLLGTITNNGSEFGMVNIITSPKGYSILYLGNNASHQIDVSLPDRMIVPFRLENGHISEDIMMLIFNPKQRELFNSSASIITQIGTEDDLVDPAKPNEVFLPNYGYNLHREEWNITNDYGNLLMQHRDEYTEYRYLYKEILVEILSNNSKIKGYDYTKLKYPGRYDDNKIHFWIIVKENPGSVLSL